jgi:hypothetical protein
MGRPLSADSRGLRGLAIVLRSYPPRWRQRHGEEAVELAALLIRDGTPAASVALSYLAGAAREWLTPRPGRRLTAVACAGAIAAGLLGVSTGLLASAGPARAASTSAAPPRPAHCGPESAALVPGAVPAAYYPQLITQRARHDQSC